MSRAVPRARLHARRLIGQWGLAALEEPVELVVSELVTNAVRASATVAARQLEGPAIVRLRLASDRQAVLIQVWDACHEPPIRREVGPDAESGRGLLLVAHHSARWGSYSPEASNGKIVWAVIEAPEPGLPPAS